MPLCVLVGYVQGSSHVRSPGEDCDRVVGITDRGRPLTSGVIVRYSTGTPAEGAYDRHAWEAGQEAAATDERRRTVPERGTAPQTCKGREDGDQPGVRDGPQTPYAGAELARRPASVMKRTIAASLQIIASCASANAAPHIQRSTITVECDMAIEKQRVHTARMVAAGGPIRIIEALITAITGQRVGHAIEVQNRRSIISDAP
jgi:hypothetical protein